MKIRKLICIFLASVILFSCTGCSKENKSINPYEKPVQTLALSLKKKDSDSYINCFATPIVNEYKQSENYDSEIAKTIYSEIETKIENQIISISYKINDKKEIDGEDLDNLSSEIQKGLEIKKAYLLTVEFKILTVKTDFYSEIDIKVGKIGGNWYICQSPELNYNFSKK